MRFRQGQTQRGFTPRSIAKALRTQATPRPEKAASVSPPAVTIDFGSLAKGAVVVGEFLLRHSARQRARASELRGSALRLASHFQGYLGAPDLVIHEGCSREQALRCLQGLEQERYCRLLCTYQGELLYVFPAFLARAWACGYCGSYFSAERSARPQRCDCPNCGAEMEFTFVV